MWLVSKVVFNLKILVIKFIIMMISVYNYITPKRDDIISEKSSEKFEHYTINEYDVYYDNKLYELCLFAGENTTEILNNINRLIQNRHVFLHCAIMHDDKYMLDITDNVRKFVYYFKKRNSNCTVERLVEYLKRIHPVYKIQDDTNCKDEKIVNMIDLNDCYIVFYMNDDTFTENKFKISDELDKTICDLLY